MKFLGPELPGAPNLERKVSGNKLAASHLGSSNAIT
jgi:hypothetical protein